MDLNALFRKDALGHDQELIRFSRSKVKGQGHKKSKGKKSLEDQYLPLSKLETKLYKNHFQIPTHHISSTNFTDHYLL